MLPGSSFAVQEFPPQCFRPGRPARSRVLAAAWVAVPAPGPRLLPARETCPSLREPHQTARGRSGAPKYAGVCRFALGGIPCTGTCRKEEEEDARAKDSVQFGFPSFPVTFWSVPLQLPLGTAATARGLNHPTASVPNKAKVSNSIETPLFGEPV